MADRTIEEMLDEMESITEALKEAGVNVSKFAGRSLKSIKDRFDAIDKTVKKSDGSFKNAISQLDALKEAIEDDVDGIQSAQQKKANLDKLEKVARQAYNETLERAGKQLIGTVVGGFANYYANQLKVGMRDLMGTGSPFQMATNLQVQAYEDVNKTLQGVAGGAEAVGTTLMMIPTPASKVAGGLLLLGGALGGFISSKATEFFTEKTKILGQAVENAYNSFLQAASAGALYAGGVTELRQIALQSGLTQEQFTKVISENRQQLAEAGYGITEGTRIVGRVTQKFATDVGKSGQTLQREMLNLGFSIEEQAGLTADVISKLKRMGGTATDAELVQATAEYAKNLRLIAELTGDDAKKRMEQAKGISEEYSFQRKFLREHNGDINALNAAQASIAKLSIDDQKAVQQAYLRGTVTNLPAILGGYRDTALKLGDILRQSTFNANEFDDIQAKHNDIMLTENNSRKEQLGAVTALTGKLNEFSKYNTDELNLAMKFNSDSLKRSREDVNKAVDPSDKFTGSLNDSVIALQNMRNTIQKDLTGAIMKFADGVPKILADFRKKLVEVGILDKSTNTDGAKTTTGQLFIDGGLFGLYKEGRLGEFIKDLAGSSNMGDASGMANGGISSGPLSGYSEILHGREAVIPLPSGDKIPVEFKNSSGANDKGMQDLMTEIRHGNQTNSSKLEAILTVMQQNNKLTSGILQHSM
jgi:hypothetical protein